MSRITLDPSRNGLAGFPDEFTVVGRDDAGDVIALAADGTVWAFLHGAGDWQTRSLAFATEAQVHAHVAFQDHFDPPLVGADVATLRARKRAIQEFAKQLKCAPYTQQAARAALETLREEIEDRAFRSSKAGRGLAACQALAQRCEQALREAGATGDWLVRAAAPDGSKLAAMGDFAPPWTSERVRALLAPLLDGRPLLCSERPRTKPKS